MKKSLAWWCALVIPVLGGGEACIAGTHLLSSKPMTESISKDKVNNTRGWTHTCTPTQTNICTHTQMYTSIHIHIYIHIYTHMGMLTYVYTHTHTYIHVHIYTQVGIYMHLHTYAHTHLYICRHVHMHVYMWKRSYFRAKSKAGGDHSDGKKNRRHYCVLATCCITSSLALFTLLKSIVLVT